MKARPPMQPFDGMVDPDPSFEQMRRLVCFEGKRPLLEDAWIRDVISFAVFLKDFSCFFIYSSKIHSNQFS